MNHHRPSCWPTCILVKVLDKLVDAGNTVVIIEHNLDVIKRADYIIDPAPRAAAAAVRSLPPARRKWPNPNSFTGQYLKPMLARAKELQEKPNKIFVNPSLLHLNCTPFVRQYDILSNRWE